MSQAVPRPILLGLAALLLAAGAGPYALFASHVLERGDNVIREPWGSAAARLPLTLAAVGIAAFAASGVTGLAALKGSRWQPFAGLGIPLAASCAVGLLAFVAGPGVFSAGGAVFACFAATAVAAASLGREQGAPWRVALLSWMTIGTLLTLGVMAVGALGVLEKQLPRVPWSAVLAGIALAALMRAMARHVGRVGQDPTPAALRHVQVRRGLETEEIRGVADRLHPFIEEGRGGADYDALAEEVALRAGGVVPRRPVAQAGPGLPSAAAGLAAVLRAAAFAAPFAFLLPGPWALAVPAILLGLLLPATRSTLLPRREPLPASWWLAGALVAGAGASFAAWLAVKDLALASAGFAFAAPYLGLALWARRRPMPEEIALLRARKAHSLVARRTVQAVQGSLVAGAFLALPAAIAGVPLLIGVGPPQAPLPFIMAGALGGLCWALAALVAGGAAQRSLAALDGAHAQQEAGRRAAHRAFLESLEAT
ncbi:MAG TPA: hypothetical protein VM241_08260 [Candidatus Thermoplasmatota archaeon]|nr:hypothetical protein [Candidatus Thermoplasmatota archaeon]